MTVIFFADVVLPGSFLGSFSRLMKDLM